MNSRGDWNRVKAVFLQALDVPEAERARWIAAECADDADTLKEVLSLLAAQSGPYEDFLDRGAGVIAPALVPPPVDRGPQPGARVGPYVLMREIGAGGMGRVFLARRVDGQFDRQVALKLIRDEFASPELSRRFLRERDTLAHLVHPNIATLLDGGVADDDTPYFTMEFVEGEPIDRWCNARQLDVRARVALVVSICDAVQYAHRNLVVHRDIKPSNILVTADGEPKLIDFGIAKPLAGAAAGHTGTAGHPMTREYAAPEQVLGEPVTIATDEYALGVLLYGLLSGRMPYRRAEAGDIGWAKAIVEEPPEPLERAIVRTSTASSAATYAISADVLRRALRGDLERILQRALAKAPDARYPTVGALADDLGAYLDGRALSGGGRVYRLRKFMRRHWLPLTATTTAVLAIVAGAAGFAWESRQRELAAESALHEAGASTAVKDFVLALFEKANPNATHGKIVTLRDAVDLGARRLDRIPDDQPALKAELQLTMAQIYFELDEYRQDIALSSQAFDALKSRPQDAVLAARAERYEATALASIGAQAKAQELADDAVQRLRVLAHAPANELARTLYTASWVALKRGDMDRVKRYVGEAQDLASGPPTDEALLYKALEMKGDWARRSGDLPLAIASYRQAIALSAKVNGPDDEESVTLGHLLGLSLEEAGRYEEALVELQRAEQIADRLFGESGSRTVRLGEVAGVAEFEAGRLIEARDRYQRLVALIEARSPTDESLLAEVRLNDAEILGDLGEATSAESLLIKVRDFLLAHDGSSPDEIAETFAALAHVEIDSGQLARAETTLQRGESTLRAAGQRDSAIMEGELSYVRLLEGDSASARELAREARDRAVKSDGERSYDIARIHYYYGLALLAADRADDAEDEWRASLASYAQLLPDGMHLQSADVRLALGERLARSEKHRDEGLRLLQQAIELRERFFGADDARARAARALVAKTVGG